MRVEDVPVIVFFILCLGMLARMLFLLFRFGWTGAPFLAKVVQRQGELAGCANWQALVKNRFRVFTLSDSEGREGFVGLAACYAQFPLAPVRLTISQAQELVQMLQAAIVAAEEVGKQLPDQALRLSIE